MRIARTAFISFREALAAAVPYRAEKPGDRVQRTAAKNALARRLTRILNIHLPKLFQALPCPLRAILFSLPPLEFEDLLFLPPLARLPILLRCRHVSIIARDTLHTRLSPAKVDSLHSVDSGSDPLFSGAGGPSGGSVRSAFGDE